MQRIISSQPRDAPVLRDPSVTRKRVVSLTEGLMILVFFKASPSLSLALNDSIIGLAYPKHHVSRLRSVYSDALKMYVKV